MFSIGEELSEGKGRSLSNVNWSCKVAKNLVEHVHTQKNVGPLH